MILIVVGSEKDMDVADRISEKLNEFGVFSEVKVASAHKSTAHLLRLMKEAEAKHRDLVYITVAGLSNGLSGVVAGNTTKPVISCPNFKTTADYLIDIHSSLRMPKDVCPMVVLKPENAALAAVKVLAASDESLEEKLAKYMENMRKQYGA